MIMRRTIPAESFHDWEQALARVAVSLPGTDARPVIPAEVARDEPETLAPWFGLIAVPIPCGNDVPAAVPVVVADDDRPQLRIAGDYGPGDMRARWALAPALSGDRVDAVPVWLLRRWLRRMAVPILAGVAALLVAVFALAWMVGSTGMVDRFGSGLVLLTASGGFGLTIAVARRMIEPWCKALEWFSRTTVLAQVLRSPADDSTGDDPDESDLATNAVMGGSILATQVGQLTGPLLALLAVTIASGIVSVLIAPPLLLVVIGMPVLAAVMMVLLLRPIHRRALGAQQAADRGRNRLVRWIDERLQDNEPPDDAAEAIERDVLATVGLHGRSRLMGLPIIMVSSLMPVVLVGITLLLWPDRLADGGSDTAALLAMVIALGAACGLTMDEVNRAAVAISPLALARDLLRNAPPLDAVGARVSPTGAVMLDRVVVNASAGPSMPISLAIAPGERWQLCHQDPVLLGNLAETMAGVRQPIAGRIANASDDPGPGTPALVRRNQAYIGRHLDLPSGDLEAVLFGASDADEEARQAVLDQLGLASVIARMPLGQSTPMLDGGRWLDAGVKLRLLLARARVREPCLTVIDQAFDSLAPDIRDDVIPLLATWPGTLVVTSAGSDVLLPGFRLFRPGSPGDELVTLAKTMDDVAR